MTDDYRLNWQMPAEPLGPAIKREPEVEFDPLTWFEKGEHLPGADAVRLLEEDMLPEGVIEGRDGEYEAECVACERWRPIYCDLSEIPATGYRHYCGGGPSCCP